MWHSNHHHGRHHGDNDCRDFGQGRFDDHDRYRGYGYDNDRHHGDGGFRGDDDCHDGGFGHGFFGHDHQTQIVIIH
jgi:hypothetical protein